MKHIQTVFESNYLADARSAWSDTEEVSSESDNFVPSKPLPSISPTTKPANNQSKNSNHKSKPSALIKPTLSKKISTKEKMNKPIKLPTDIPSATNIEGN